MLGAFLKGGLKTALGLTAGYGVAKGTGYMADQAGQGVGPYSVGGGITGALRVGGALLGGGMMAGTAIRAVGRMGSVATRGLGRGVPTRATSRLQGTMGRMSNFSAGKLAGQLAFGGVGASSARVFGKKVPSVAGAGIGLAKSIGRVPIAMASNVAGAAGLGLRKAGLGAVGSGLGKLGSYGNRHIGAGLFGWGVAAGAGKIAFEQMVAPNSEMLRADPTAVQMNRDRMRAGYAGEVNAAAGRNMPLAGQQTWDPTRMRGPRRTGMGAGGTDGLVQSLHALR